MNVTGTFHYSDSDLQLEEINVYYNQVAGAKYVVDFEPDGLYSVRAGIFRQLFTPDSFVFEQSAVDNNWVKGYYTESAESMDSVLDVIEKKKVDYNSLQASDKTIECYNTTSCVHQAEENIAEAYYVDNKVLCDMCTRSLKLTISSYRDLNHLVSAALSLVAKYLYFPDKLNSDLPKLTVNLNTFSRLYFSMPSFVLLNSRNSTLYCLLTLLKVFNAKNIMATCDFSHCPYLTIAVKLYGRMCLEMVDEQMRNIQEKYSCFFVGDIPSNCKTVATHHSYSRVTQTYSTINEKDSTKAEFITNDLTSEYKDYEKVIVTEKGER
uniref:Tubulin/FtsZ GTPase domain-containing protein n=1 Tax=Glossina brevipalpis TaxID=37001 RepID=A0A1A9WY69_9MUSC